MSKVSLLESREQRDIKAANNNLKRGRYRSTYVPCIARVVTTLPESPTAATILHWSPKKKRKKERKYKVRNLHQGLVNTRYVISTKV